MQRTSSRAAAAAQTLSACHQEACMRLLVWASLKQTLLCARDPFLELADMQTALTWWLLLGAHAKVNVCSQHVSSFVGQL